jgi:Leucine-rich repeat (LRR) protein
MQKLNISILTLTLLLLTPSLRAQDTPYRITHRPLPASMDRQVCISGVKYLDGKLYFASERCPALFVFDPVSNRITDTLHTQPGQEFEVEGLTSYKGKLYAISENVAAVYEVDPEKQTTRTVSTSKPLPPKSKDGDGMEGIAANETHGKFYLLRERNEDMSRSQIFTCRAETDEQGRLRLTWESMTELTLPTPQWRYSDITYDPVQNRLLLLKSFSKGKLRQQFVEALPVNEQGNLVGNSVQNLPVENFSLVSNQYKDLDYSMNLEGITVLPDGTLFLVSDNTSGKAQCELTAKEKTILLELRKGGKAAF